MSGGIPLKQPWMTLRIAERTEEAAGIVSLLLVDPDGGALPPFSAGAHIDIELAAGLVRQYSLCNAPDDGDGYRIGVLLDPATRGGSVAIHALAAGDTIRTSAPRNHFALDASATRSLLIAGGIGITPILSMADRLSNIGAPFALHYCTRSRAATAFAKRIGEGPLASSVRFHTDDGDADQRFDAAAVLASPDAGTHLYVCGPTGFMDHVLRTATAAGWPDERLHREYFTAVAVDTSGDGAFDVMIASTGRVLTIPPGRSVVTVLEAAGIEIPVSCEEGVCGTCLTFLLGGEVDHRDSFLTPQERAANDQFTPCCSRSTGGMLTLDL